MSCHIHPPTTNKDEAPKIIGPYPAQQACEKARLEQFGNKGRCHCSFDGMPRLNQPSIPFGDNEAGGEIRP
ncbi:MAG: hypothetical protein OEY52_13630 [Gammaproteobacteria bacterium]|nr:hypothetical protein [Gammaproteobacteria bacterium]